MLHYYRASRAKPESRADHSFRQSEILTEPTLFFEAHYLERRTSEKDIIPGNFSGTTARSKCCATHPRNHCNITIGQCDARDPVDVSNSVKKVSEPVTGNDNVRVNKSDELRTSPILTVTTSGPTALVCSVLNEMKASMHFGHGFNNFGSRVSRSVINDQNLKGLFQHLVQECRQTALNIGFFVEGDDNNDGLHVTASCVLCVRRFVPLGSHLPQPNTFS